MLRPVIDAVNARAWQPPGPLSAALPRAGPAVDGAMPGATVCWAGGALGGAGGAGWPCWLTGWQVFVSKPLPGARTSMMK